MKVREEKEAGVGEGEGLGPGKVRKEPRRCARAMQEKEEGWGQGRSQSRGRWRMFGAVSPRKTARVPLGRATMPSAGLPLHRSFSSFFLSAKHSQVGSFNVPQERP